jgi:hypothetical protein
MLNIMMRGCRFLSEVVLKDDGFPPGSLLKILKDFAYAYMPRLHTVTVICRRGDGEVTIALTYDCDAVYNVCLHACARAIRDARSSLQFSWADATDVIDFCRRECRGAAAELIKQDVDAGIKLLRDLLKSANIAHKVVAKADNGVVLAITL